MFYYCHWFTNTKPHHKPPPPSCACPTRALASSIQHQTHTNRQQHQTPKHEHPHTHKIEPPPPMRQSPNPNLNLYNYKDSLIEHPGAPRARGLPAVATYPYQSLPCLMHMPQCAASSAKAQQRKPNKQITNVATANQAAEHPGALRARGLPAVATYPYQSLPSLMHMHMPKCAAFRRGAATQTK